MVSNESTATEMDIVSFTDEHRFLSNFWPVEVFFEGNVYSSVEHAYVAAKTISEEEREIIRNLDTPGKVKRYGRTIELRDDWDKVKISVMHNLLIQKFKAGSQLHDMLMATGNRNLIEGNSWKDTFWGECPLGYGENNLGKLLMSIRDDVMGEYVSC